jgi:hypothetical protein
MEFQQERGFQSALRPGADWGLDSTAYAYAGVELDIGFILQFLLPILESTSSRLL